MPAGNVLLFVALGIVAGVLLFGPRIKGMILVIRDKIKNRKKKTGKDDDTSADSK